jgi:hypothetical protein
MSGYRDLSDYRGPSGGNDLHVGSGLILGEGQTDYRRYNGRVDLTADPGEAETVIRMQERVAVKNRATEYAAALAGVWETSPLSQAYFSAANVQILQNGIRAGVYQQSGRKWVVPPQNAEALHTVMRSVYLQHAQHGRSDVRGEIAALNRRVLDFCVPNVMSAGEAYLKYVRDVSVLNTPMDPPVRPDRAYKQLQTQPFV